MHNIPHREETKKILSRKQSDLWKLDSYRNNVISKLMGKVPHNKLPTKIVNCKCCNLPFSISENSNQKYYPGHYQKLMKSDLNPAKQSEIKNKISNTLMKTYKNHPEILENRKPCGKNQYSGSYTSIEKLIHESLSKIGMPHSHNVQIGRYFADFIIMRNVVIECDGEYWHTDKSKDFKKDSYLMDRGFFVFRLQEYDILRDSDSCACRIINIMKNIGYEDQMRIYINRKIKL